VARQTLARLIRFVEDSWCAMNQGPFDNLSPEELQELTRRAKGQLRKRMRALRQAYPAEARQARSERIAGLLEQHPAFRAAQTVGLFWPMESRHEVDLRALDARARALGKAVAYPFLRHAEGRSVTGFAVTEREADLSEQGQGFLEPARQAQALERGQLELVVVPALAVAGSGHRLGYGRGYYDVTLPDFCPPAVSIAVAFEFQLLIQLPEEEGDFRCDFVVTDQRVIDARPEPAEGASDAEGG
jgi:5-formyltetrahydrofolate cyclo-ligase